MNIFVGSINPVKINAVTIAASQNWPEVVVKGFPSPSLVSDQPRTDEETRLGSENRAKHALEAGLEALQAATNQRIDSQEIYLGVGLEGGVVEFVQGELWCTVWATVVDQDDNIFSSNGSRFKLHQLIAEPIQAGGEMGPVVEKILKVSDIRKKQGMIGVVTNNLVDRTEEYMNIAKTALGLWYGRDWHRSL